MQKADIKAGIEYAHREKLVVGAPLERVRIIANVRANKWRAEWVSPNAGLTDFVESGHLVCTWKDRKEFLREEAARTQLLVDNERHGYVRESPVDLALYEVFENIGDEVTYYHGVLSGRPDPMARVKTRAGLGPLKQSPYAYVDRQGEIHLPYGEAQDLARAFCAVEPAAVLAHIEASERQWAQEARLPGEEHRVGLLNQYRAVWALIRQWVGHDRAVAEREAEIQRLERLVWDAVYALQRAGQDREAQRLRRAITRE